MRRAAMASAGARTLGPGPSFEALEARQFLSAPTATATAPEVYSSGLYFHVTYHSDAPLDVSTIGEQDVAVTGPGGFAQWANWGLNEYLDNGDVRVFYSVAAPNGHWDWHTANGTYNVGIAADAVRNTAGEGNAEGGLGSYWLWFTPQITMTDQRLVTGIGRYYQDSDPFDDAWTFQFQQNTGYVESAPLLVLHITGPNGYDQTGFAREHLSYRQSPRSGYQVSVGGGVYAPGGSWDFTDSGDYTLEVGNPGPGSTYDNPTMGELVMTRTFTLNIGAPHAEMVSVTNRERDVLVAVRYTPAPGASIDLSSISDGDVGTNSLIGRLTGPAVLNGDGSVTAEYSIASPHPEGWRYDERGRYSIRTIPGEVRDNTGRAVGVGPIGSTTLSIDPPSVIGLRTLGATVAAWDLELSFRNVGGALNNMTLGGNNLSAFAWINGVYQQAPVNIQFISSSNSPDNILAVHYRILARQGFLWNGTFDIVMNPQTMGDPAWILSDLRTTMVMQFAGPSVQGLRTVTRTGTAWDVELSFDNPASLISTSSLSGQNLLLGAPGGRGMRITMISFASGADHALRVRYRITSMTNGTALPHGTYGFSLRGGSVMAAGVGLPGQFLANMTI